MNEDGLGITRADVPEKQKTTPTRTLNDGHSRRDGPITQDWNWIGNHRHDGYRHKNQPKSQTIHGNARMGKSENYRPRKSNHKKNRRYGGMN